MTAIIRPAGSRDIAPVCTLLHERMNKRIAHDRWRRLMTYPWLADKPDLGWVVEQAGRIAGYLGVVYADRDCGDQTARTANLTSWYLDRSLRGQGVGREMLARATADDQVTYTTFSSTPKALELMRSVGLGPLDEERFTWWPSGSGTEGLSVLTDPSAIAPHLCPRARRVFDDHARFNIHPFLLRPAGGEACLALLSIREKGPDTAYHEALYLSAPRVMAEYAQAFANTILPPQQALLAIDCRFLRDHGVDAATEQLPVPRHFKSARLAARDIDFLYSETVLLDLKLY